MKNYNLKIRELGEAIKILRNRKGLTQKQLASAAGVSSRQVRLLEHGKHSGGIETIWMSTDGIDCNIFELLVLA
ncbi:MAG: helix-turn-helix domain-containing protein [Phascolarctobacterium sp.]|nr:helix-turn-helix domain-containing protein [Phascolarctobacterium sp.]